MEKNHMQTKEQAIAEWHDDPGRHNLPEEGKPLPLRDVLVTLQMNGSRDKLIAREARLFDHVH